MGFFLNHPFGISPFLYLTFDPGNLFLFRGGKKNNTHTHPTSKNISLQSKIGFLSHIFLYNLSWHLPCYSIVSDTKGVEGRELVSKVTTDRELLGLESWSAHLEGDTIDNADINSVIVKVRSLFSMKYLEILKSDKGANFWW